MLDAEDLELLSLIDGQGPLTVTRMNPGAATVSVTIAIVPVRSYRACAAVPPQPYPEIRLGRQ